MLYFRESMPPRAAAVRRTYRNPVFAHDAPDPSIILGGDGLYHLYSTQSSYGRWANIPMLTSPDLVHWQFVGDALPRLPAWSEGQSWAPHIDRAGNGYRLYFATQTRSGDFAIALATSSSLYGPFVDIGRPVVSGRGIDALDPFVLDMPDGSRILYWGSGGAPIQAARLSPDGAGIMGTPRPLLFADPSGRTPYERLIEGAWVLPHGGWYYLMYSGDRCCLSAAHYAVMVARSASPFGPFLRDPNNPILASNGAFHAPGHNATIEDAAGQDWIIYHAMQPGDNQDRVLMLDPIEWTAAGWPLVDGGRGPSAWPMPAPIIGH
jgi:arabinan endo-1,5-alpha-L-arabinosidase